MDALSCVTVFNCMWFCLRNEAAYVSGVGKPAF